MNVEQLPGNVWYYTDLVSDSELDLILDSVRLINDWVRVYDDGHTYDPNRDKSQNEFGSIMLASRKKFTTNAENENISYEEKYRPMADIMNRVLQESTSHYAKENNLSAMPMAPFQNMDRHLVGTCYQTHCDTAPIGVDSRTVLIYVNDDYKGGELSFTLPNQPHRKVKMAGGISEYGYGAKVAYPPNDERNSGLVDYWIKPKAMSVVIFPPDGLPHSAHEVLGSNKYMVKAYWQLQEHRVEQWTSNPYEGRTEEEILRVNPEGFVINDYQHQDIKSGKNIVPDEYRNLEY